MFGDSFSGEWGREPRTGFSLRRFRISADDYDVALSIPDQPAPEAGFPLLVVMDGALHFDAAAAAARALARRPEKTGVGPMAVLGIASGVDWSHDAARRERDLLPDGAGALRDLIPSLIADAGERAPIDPAHRAIFGHSYGGLFALDMIAHAPGLFAACIALSPSLWRAPDLAQRLAGSDARILITSGEHEPKINASLDDATDPLASATRVVLPGEDHGSIVFAALPMALRFIHGTRH